MRNTVRKKVEKDSSSHGERVAIRADDDVRRAWFEIRLSFLSLLESSGEEIDAMREDIELLALHVGVGCCVT